MWGTTACIHLATLFNKFRLLRPRTAVAGNEYAMSKHLVCRHQKRQNVIETLQRYPYGGGIVSPRIFIV